MQPTPQQQQQQQQPRRAPRRPTKHPFLAFFLPALAACLCILLSAVLIASLHYHPYIYWNLHAAAWSVIALALLLLPHYLAGFAPMLLFWAFWFSLQGEIAVYWRLVDNGITGPVPFSDNLYRASLAGMFLLGTAQHLQPVRSTVGAALSSTAHALLLCTVPKPRVANEWLVMAQVSVYVLLYVAGHVVLEVYALRWREEPGRPALAFAKLLFSAWALWVPGLWLLVALGSLQLLGALGSLLYNYAEFTVYYARIAEEAAAVVGPDHDEEDPAKQK